MAEALVVPVRRRLSPVDPEPGSWAIIGWQQEGPVGAAFDRAGVPWLAYDADPVEAESEPRVRSGHRVIAVEEIDDMDLLAVTTEDTHSGDIATDYFSGIVIQVAGSDGWEFLDSEVANVHGGRPVLAHHLFTPRHPALVAIPPATEPETQRLRADLVARYAALLWEQPRRALAFHRHVCAPLLPGWPELLRDPDDDRAETDVLAADLESLGA